MVSRIGTAVAIFLLAASSAAAQVIRFETSVGDFDMLLNPTNDARLQGNVDNMLQYVEDNRYRSSWINRAPESFVLQMGSLFSHTKRPPLTIASTRPVATFDPVEGAPATELGLSNTVGTVALALPSDINQNPLQDAGTSSFFINLATNDFLDPNFTVFAAIPDMTVINEIMALMQIDRTTDPFFGAGSNDATFQDVPIQDNGFQVFIDRTFVVQDVLEVARARAGVQSVIEQSMAAAAPSLMQSAGGVSAGSSAPLLAPGVVPEPSTAALALITLTALSAMRRRTWGGLSSLPSASCGRLESLPDARSLRAAPASPRGP